MNYYPLNYSQINVHAGCYNPSMVKSYNNKTFAYWERSLFQRAASSIILENLPDTWEGARKDFLFYSLFKFGFVGVANDEKYGLFFQPGTLSGFDFYYQPTTFKLSNPALSKDYTIGEDCELMKLTPDYLGIWDIISYYAEKLSVLDNAINISLINNKFAFFMGARNKSAAEAIKKMLDKINKGEPAIVYDTKLLNDPTDKAEPWQFLERNNLKQSYLTTDQLRDFQTILNNFDTEIGIPTIPYEKKERMTEYESNSRKFDATSRATIWVDTLNSSLNLVNEHYNLNMSAKLRYEEEELKGVDDNGI